MSDFILLAKANSDGSYSVAISADMLVQHAFVDFYREDAGTGYQRDETTRAKRGRDIESYIRRCTVGKTKPALFEMTANARVEDEDWFYEALDESGELGFLHFRSPEALGKFISMIDGGTRLIGIETAVTKNVIAPEIKFDLRIFIKLSIPAEIAYFLLINDTQKKVRTDLGLRVVQRLLDDGKLTDREMEILKSAVPDTDSWKYDAIRLAGALNSDPSGKWHQRIQMPGQTPRSTTLQAFFSSLNSLLTADGIRIPLSEKADNGELVVDKQAVEVREYLERVLRNFWDAVAAVNPDADAEPLTTVLWAPIGSNAHHIAFADVMTTLIANGDYNFSKARFEAMMSVSDTASYEFWFTKPGSKKTYYPNEKGDATTMTGVANYKRLGKMLAQQWRAQLHATTKAGVVSA